ncbi:MAG: hypothetical protein P0S96_01815 [Simkaniaceae bacterium]|nr:hypothetical protein [Candidatus Sacchlamyda saccharinae]
MRYALLSLLFPLLLSAEITTSSISSKKASYDGNALMLKGEVELEHALGHLQSGAARLIRESEGAPFTSIYLRDDVRIALKNRGEIHCAKADFDFNDLKGKLLPARGQMIEFLNLQTEPLSLLSKEAEIEFVRENNSLRVAKIKACKSVEVHYSEDFVLTADGATFSNTKTPYVWASPNCVLNHFDDQIQAERIEILPASSKMILSSPSGALSSPTFSEDELMEFSCNKLVWERALQMLTMKGNVKLHDAGIGDLYCEDEVEIRQKEVGDKWALSQISAKGKTSLQYKLDADFEHTLVCYGQMELNQDRLALTLESPIGQPLEYFHDGMKLTADHAELDYTQGKDSIHPEKLLLQGNIQLSTTEDSSRCAIADQFAYFPDEKKIILSTKQENPVLFWDAEQKLSISAREIHITRGEKGENIKGVGNVRFAFSSTENALLKKLFPFYQINGRPQ